MGASLCSFEEPECKGHACQGKPKSSNGYVGNLYDLQPAFPANTVAPERKRHA